MANTILFARLLLAAIFILAGVAKLTDQPATKQGFVDFRIPSSLVPSLSILIPLAELIIALFLLSAVGAWWGAVGAFALLLIFNGAIFVNLYYGHKPNCHCFGSFSPKPISQSTLIRNIIFIALAAFIVWQGRIDAGFSFYSWLAARTLLELLFFGLLIVTLVEGWFIVQLMTQQGRLLQRLEQLEHPNKGQFSNEVAPNTVKSNGIQHKPVKLNVGMRAPILQLPDLEGRIITLADFLGSETIVLFLDPNCSHCQQIIKTAASWQGASRLLIVSTGLTDNHQSLNLPVPTVIDNMMTTMHAYGIIGTPAAIVVNTQGLIASKVAFGGKAVMELLTSHNNTEESYEPRKI